jgi:hypothetical protein
VAEGEGFTPPPLEEYLEQNNRLELDEHGVRKEIDTRRWNDYLRTVYMEEDLLEAYESEAPEKYAPQLVPFTAEAVGAAQQLGVLTGFLRASAINLFVDNPDAGETVIGVLAEALEPDLALKALFLLSAVNVSLLMSARHDLGVR